MIKKGSKLFAFSIMLLVISIAPVFAKEMNLNEFGKEVEKYNKDAEYAYIIGNYAFTSAHKLTTQDIMLASRSIKVSDDAGEKGENKKTNVVADKIYGEMTIHLVERTYDKNWTPTGWKVVNNKVGDTKLKLDNEQKIDIRYIDYNFIAKDTPSTVELIGESDTNYKDVVKKYFSKLGKQDLSFSSDSTDTVKYLEGMLLKTTTLNENVFNKKETTGYYFALALKVPGATGETGTTIKVKGANTEKEFKYEQFDVTNGDPGIALLYSVDPKTANDEKKLTITIDFDGSSKEYAPKTYTIDYSKLTFQEDSKVKEIGLGKEKATEADKTTMKNWGYEADKNTTLTLTPEDNSLTYKLSGTLVEQMLNSADAFGASNKLGYYFDFTFVLPEGSDKNTVKISQVKDKEGNNTVKDLKPEEYDDHNNLTILFRFKPDTTKCSGESCKIYYKVDLDGDGTKYLPVVYTIDYTGVTFEKSSVFTVSGITDGDASEYENFEWHDTKNGYSVKVAKDQNDEKKYHVTGVLPIFDDTEGDFNTDETFDTEENLYYLGLLLKLSNAEKIDSSGSDAIDVKFFHNDGTGDDQFLSVSADDFDSSHELYILKALCDNGGTLSDAEKVFTITVDLDGDADTYAPYTVTIDWSGLVLQAKSIGDFGNYDVIKSETDLGNDTKAKAELTSYGYTYANDSEVSVKTGYQEEAEHASKEGLAGTIKEQTLKETAGFKDSKGYFVPIKVEFPGEEIPELTAYKDKWTLILNTEDSKTFEYVPTKEEYAQGWVMVLFKIYREDKTEIKYQIDFDGSPKGDKGYDFVPFEYKIDYSELNFKDVNNITLHYRDKNGDLKTDNVTIYEGEQLGHDLAEAQNLDYRTFDGWYKDNKTKVEVSQELGKDDDLELTAHWKINAEKFISEVITDLNSTDDTYSNDFSGKFSLEQDEADKKAITINIDGAKVPLTELAETSIPGAIAYALQKGEIKEISLTAGATNTVKFDKNYKNNSKTYDKDASRDNDLLGEEGVALKKEIIKGAKEVFDKELSENEETATLDQLEYANKTFTIKIDSVDDTVTLVKDDETAVQDVQDKTYTFKFDSDFVVVDEDAPLGATDINSALTSKKNYNTVYIDGDINLENTLNITTDNEVAIKPVESASKVSRINAEKPTITVKEQEYAVDIQKGDGTVTISNLKITGGTKAELRIEDGANVVVDNLDVSGEIRPVTQRDEKMHAGIIVRGNLTVNSKIKNDNEKYGLPTVAVVTSYSYPTGKELEGDHQTDDGTLTKNGTVTDKSNMAKNDKYYIVKKDETGNIDSFKETYYGSFYYSEANNSKIYLAGIIDSERKSSGPYDYIKIYYYDDNFDLKGLGYEVGKTPAGVDTGKVFKNFTLNGEEITWDGSVKVQNILDVANIAHIVANYQSASLALNEASVTGLKMNGNSISGTLKIQSTDGKYNIPVVLTSNLFQEDVSTVKVTDPNGKEKTYTYSSSNEKGIALASTVKTMKLELEAIKSSKITKDNGKVYEITVDIDGAEEDQYQEESHTINYDGVTTLEEKINNAAKNTQDANSLTIVKNNKIKDGTEKFTYQYDKEKEVTLYNDDKSDEEYTFKYQKVDPSHTGPIIIAVRKPATDESRPKIGDYEFANFFKKVSKGYQELTLLQDVMKQTTTVDAISKVQAVKGEEHKYEVTLNKDRLNEWLDNAYMSSTVYDEEHQEKEAEKESGSTEDNNVILEVVLDTQDKYLVSMKTKQNFSVTSASQVKYDDNKIDVTFSNVNSTTIKTPLEFFGKEGKPATLEQVKNFYEACKTWHTAHTGGVIYEG